jgi:hypothetical protein
MECYSSACQQNGVYYMTAHQHYGMRHTASRTGKHISFGTYRLERVSLRCAALHLVLQHAGTFQGMYHDTINWQCSVIQQFLRGLQWPRTECWG